MANDEVVIAADRLQQFTRDILAAAGTPCAASNRCTGHRAAVSEGAA